MPRTSLVDSIPPGPVDIIGDVHGDIDGLNALLGRLGADGAEYRAGGRHLVFVGDLIDRGANSPAVIARVRALVAAGRAQCILGNHEINLILDRRKEDNIWFFGDEQPGSTPSAAKATPSDRAMIPAFLSSLPLALERGDLRIVHACWNSAMIAAARAASDVIALYQSAAVRLATQIAKADLPDKTERTLAAHNGNPVRILAYGPERRADQPFFAGGKTRHEERVRWWDDYRDETLCVFGHYWRPYTAAPDNKLFAGLHPETALGTGRVMCVDYVDADDSKSGSRSKLAALRFPEMELVFADGGRAPVTPPPTHKV